MEKQIRELDVVALLEDIPSEHLSRGEVGTVVDDFGDGVFLVEFSDRLGQTYSLPELKQDQILLLHHLDRAEIPV